MNLKKYGIFCLFFLVAFFTNFLFDLRPNITNAEEKTEIYDWVDLYNIRNDLTEDYILVNDLDENTNGYTAYASPTANAGAGWIPIGSSEASFTGTFEGNGHSISDFYINNTVDGSGEYLGLFGQIAGNSIVRNFSLSGDVNFYRWSGCLVGVQNSASSLVEFVDVNCNVNGVHSRAGGVVGWQINGLIRNVSFEGSVGGNDYVGGIAGQQASSGLIQFTHTSGTINSTSNHVGGIIGYQSGQLGDSYSSASVTAAQGSVGGVTGNLQPSGQIVRTYATGVVTGASWASSKGGVVGNASGSVIDSIYNTETTTRDKVCGAVSGDCTESFGYDTLEMKDISTYENLDWDIEFNINNEINDGYPYLSWQVSDNNPVWYIHISVSDTPNNVSPVNLSNNTNLNPQISASNFSNSQNDNHVDTEWQLDNDSDFSSPVWTRVANVAETQVVVNDLHGSFENELSGEIELNYESTYYWRVRYMDDGSNQWSNWSSPTSFTTLNQYTLTFDTVGGTPTSPISEYYTLPITKPADPEKTGNLFLGWTPEIPDTMPALNQTHTALWEKAENKRKRNTSFVGNVLDLKKMDNVTQSKADERIDILVSKIVNLLIELNIIVGDIVTRDQGSANSLSENEQNQNNQDKFARNLYFGLEGEDVMLLQEYLINKGYSIPFGATGFFGGETKAALIQFQIENNIEPAIGYFGPMTKSILQ